MNSKIYGYLLALVMLVGTVAVAQDLKRPTDLAKLRQEVRYYQHQHVAPFLKELRLELDKKLSEADKTELADIREQMARYRQEQMQLFRQLRAEQSQDNTPPTQELKAAYKEAQNNYRAQLFRLAELTKRNQKDLAEIGAKVKARQEKWKSDLQAIADKYDLPERTESDQTAKHSTIKERYYQHWNTIRFLLMDPNQPAQYFLKDKPSAPVAPTAQLNPNPATNIANLQFTVTQRGNVRIELLDQSGKTLQQVVNESFLAGKHEQSVDLSQLKSGVYFYRVTSETGSETIRFIKR